MIDCGCSLDNCDCVGVIRLVICCVVDMMTRENHERCKLEISSNRKFEKTRKSQRCNCK